MARGELSDHVRQLVEEELRAFVPQGEGDLMMLRDFARLRVRPRPITVNFSGGVTQICYSVTRSDGDYSVFFLPTAGYFSLCVDSMFGPVDIGVHGPALSCFASV